MQQEQWNALAQKAKREKIISQTLLLGFLFIVTMPVIIPFIWLITASLADGRSGVDSSLLWQVLAVAMPAILFSGLFSAYMKHYKYYKLISRLILLMAFVVILWILKNKFYWNYNFFSLEAVKNLTQDGGYPTVWKPLLNSLLMAFTVTILVVVVSVLAGFYIARFQFPGRKVFMIGLIILHSFPARTLTIPIFLVMFWLGALDNMLSVILVMTALELPFSIFIMKGFFDHVPWSVEMSAMTDGATRFQAFYKVILPMISNGVVAISVFAFIRGWGEYIFVNTLLINNTDQWVMSQYLFTIADEAKDVNYGVVAALGVIYLIPSVIMYVFAQKQLSQMSMGGTKG